MILILHELLLSVDSWSWKDTYSYTVVQWLQQRDRPALNSASSHKSLERAEGGLAASHRHVSEDLEAQVTVRTLVYPRGFRDIGSVSEWFEPPSRLPFHCCPISSARPSSHLERSPFYLGVRTHTWRQPQHNMHYLPVITASCRPLPYYSLLPNTASTASTRWWRIFRGRPALRLRFQTATGKALLPKHCKQRGEHLVHLYR